MNLPPAQQPYTAPRSFLRRPIYEHPNSQPQLSLLGLILRGILTVCVSFFLTVIILWAVHRPQPMRIFVPSADLRRFSLSEAGGDRLLSFDLSFNLTNINCDVLDAHELYEDLRFGWATMPGFRHDRRETKGLTAEFEGRAAFPLNGEGAEEYRRQNAASVFSVDVWVIGSMRYTAGLMVPRRYVMTALCDLRLPLAKGY
ncbi:hypothetical protein HPP92_006816 [Vanilla planifolia]|uniref:Late embryogenesis abundant protein LEA-2 subgroup domain-containing protein n=1 Tax=Vanilla planifolia TaxID=51239 RepID=A0A835V8T8_VANPL|nr:hypothetical protein HPP92_006816 [Vanilla planifolia]